MYDLIAQGVTIALVIYFGLHLRQKLQTVQATVAFQEKTIAAQAEQMKAQSTVLQDVERLNKLMQQIINFVDPEAALRREQAFQARVQRDADDRFKELCKRLEEIDERSVKYIIDLAMQGTAGATTLLYDLLPFVYPPLRQALIEVADLTPERKADFQLFEQILGYTPVTDDASLEALWDQQRKSPFVTNLTRLAHARAKVIEQPLLSDPEAPSQSGPQA